jgi:hypothetical protein
MAWYWALLGTIRESGLVVISTHFSHLLSTPKWAPGYKKWGNPSMQRKHDDVFQYISFFDHKHSKEEE